MSGHTGVNAQTAQSSKRELLSLGRELRGGVRLLSLVVVGPSSDPGLRLMRGEELEGLRVLGE